MRIGVNSGSLPKHLRDLEFSNPVEALVTAAVEFVELMERLDFTNFKVSMKSTSVPNTIASNRLLARADPLPAAPRGHRGGHEVVGLAEVGGRAGHAAGRRNRRHDPHLAVDLPRRGGGQGRLGDPQGAEAARARPRPHRLPDLRAPAVRHGLGRDRDRAAPARPTTTRSRSSVLGCAVNGIGEARHADFGITGAKDAGMIFSQRRAAEEGAHRSAGRRAVRGDRPLLRRGARPSCATRRRPPRPPPGWSENEDASQLTPERMAALEEAAADGVTDGDEASGATRTPIDEAVSPVAGRRFTRA